MRKSNENMIKGVAIGALAGSAVAAAGVYMAKTNPKQMKKMVHKATKTGEQLAHTVADNVQRIMTGY